MKVTNGEIVQAKEAAEKLAKKQLPVSISYNVAVLSNKLRAAAGPIEQTRQGLIQEYGEKDDKGRIFLYPPGNKEHEVSDGWENFAKAVTELMSIETEFNQDSQIELPLEIESKCPECNKYIKEPLLIEPEILMPLEKFITVK